MVTFHGDSYVTPIIIVCKFDNLQTLMVLVDGDRPSDGYIKPIVNFDCL